MTGFGEARYEDDQLRVAAEIRTVNNRYLKINVRCGEPMPAVESEIEKTVRARLSRGTVNVSLRMSRAGASNACRLNAEVVGRYLDELASLGRKRGEAEAVGLRDVLALPGVVEENEAALTLDADELKAVHKMVDEALTRLNEMRRREGHAMAEELRGLCDGVEQRVEAISGRAPRVVVEHRDRIHEKVRKLLDKMDVELDKADLIREVSIFAERCDIGEELVRLRSHIEQFRALLGQEDSTGRKLDFLTQEMFREANTIGAKSNDVAIGREVVDLKEAIERMRELVQNVE